jgi:hypothetical protein
MITTNLLKIVRGHIRVPQVSLWWLVYTCRWKRSFDLASQKWSFRESCALHRKIIMTKSSTVKEQNCCRVGSHLCCLCSLWRHLGHLLSWSSFILVVACRVDCEQWISQEIKRNARRNEGEMTYCNAQQMMQLRWMQGTIQPLTENASILLRTVCASTHVLPYSTKDLTVWIEWIDQINSFFSTKQPPPQFVLHNWQIH